MIKSEFNIICVIRVIRGLLIFATLVAVTPLRGVESAFSYPQPGRHFVFPRDHGSHPDFKIEWWYITGHLFAENGQRFGFQATFFRTASKPGAPNSEPVETFGDNPLYLAHMALLDVATGKFIYQERLNRTGWDAASSTETLDVRNGNWSLKFDGAPGEMSLIGGIRSEALFQLKLAPAKPLVIFGENGVSRKGADTKESSHYLTFPRIKTSGTLRMGEREIKVTGEAWMDHEISSAQLSRDQVGWDWAAIQLKDGREIMAYRMRLADGSTDRFSTLAWIDSAGKPRHFSPDQFDWKPISNWKSPHSGAAYPSAVEITAPNPDGGAPTKLRLVPFAADQELRGGIGGVTYWEGACRVLDERGVEIGSAFLELTGYSAELKGVR